MVVVFQIGLQLQQLLMLSSFSTISFGFSLLLMVLSNIIIVPYFVLSYNDMTGAKIRCRFFEPPDNSNQKSFPLPQSNTVILSIFRPIRFCQPAFVFLEGSKNRDSIVLQAQLLLYIVVLL